MEKSIIINILQKHMSRSMVYHCINGKRRPSYQMIRKIEIEGIPHSAWDNFPLFINNSTPSKKCEQELQGAHK